MRLVILESPYAGPSAVAVASNLDFARKCMRDCLLRGEAPFASHMLYTQDEVLDDRRPEDRALGIEAGLAWGLKADATVVYVDRGVSNGMRLGVARAIAVGRPIEFRVLMRGNESLIDEVRASLSREPWWRER